MKALALLPRPFDVSLRIGDRALERLAERWLAHDQDGSQSQARTVGELLDALQPGLTISPALDALRLAPSATHTFHNRWGATAPNTPHNPQERLTATHLEFSSSALAGTTCHRRWQCPSVFLPAARMDSVCTDARYSGFGPEDVAVSSMTSELVKVAALLGLSSPDLFPPTGVDTRDINAHISNLGHLLTSTAFDSFDLPKRGLKPAETSLAYRYADALGAVSEATGTALQKASTATPAPATHALLSWIWLLRQVGDIKLPSGGKIGAGGLQLADLVPAAPPSGLGLSQQDWADVTSDLRLLLDAALRAPRFFREPGGASDFRILQGQLPFALLNLVWLSPALLLSGWRLGPSQIVQPPGTTIIPQLLGVALDARCRVRSVDGGVRADYLFTGADILAGTIDDAINGNLLNNALAQAIRSAAPVIGQIAATAAMPEHATARLVLEPLDKRLKLSAAQADEILASSVGMDTSAGPNEDPCAKTPQPVRARGSTLTKNRAIIKA